MIRMQLLEEDPTLLEDNSDVVVGSGCSYWKRIRSCWRMIQMLLPGVEEDLDVDAVWGLEESARQELEGTSLLEGNAVTGRRSEVTSCGRKIIWVELQEEDSTLLEGNSNAVAGNGSDVAGR